MPTMPALDLTELLKGIPRGAWVAVSMDHERVVAFGSDLTTVLAEAKKNGEADPLITRVPESASSLMF